MLALGRANVRARASRQRVSLELVDAKGTPYEDGAFGATISNSIVHHIPEPARCFAEMWRVTAKGGLLFVRDLHRPENEAEVDRLVALYGGEAPADPTRVASFENQRALFRASLCAALTVAEIAAHGRSARSAGLGGEDDERSPLDARLREAMTSHAAASVVPFRFAALEQLTRADVATAARLRRVANELVDLRSHRGRAR